ncbi:hypothetical protein E4U17_008124 [Claviceps sp. LM77 group G4]|nr:hypothetical protein E4U17_008124 [Claviceps sp. LM77 group G4]KAG6079409.1 hypothetical protein E4U33_000224 [Claviceps sp. LM78 group G4]KAG6079509.1 hypothetical protein E4U16_001000 [Claviceps sp. LM84 group G4]
MVATTRRKAALEEARPTEKRPHNEDVESADRSRRTRKRKRSEVGKGADEEAYADDAPEDLGFYRNIAERAWGWWKGSGEEKRLDASPESLLEEPEVEASPGVVALPEVLPEVEESQEVFSEASDLSERLSEASSETPPEASPEPLPEGSPEEETFPKARSDVDGSSDALSDALSDVSSEVSSGASLGVLSRLDPVTEGRQRPTNRRYRPVKPGHEEEQTSVHERGCYSNGGNRRPHNKNNRRSSSISVDMTYMEPESEGVHAETISLRCSEVNQLIEDMKKTGWTNDMGDWSNSLEPPTSNDVNEAEGDCTARTRKRDSKTCKLFWKQTAKFRELFCDMPDSLESQSHILRERSQEVEARLCSMRDLAQEIKRQAIHAENLASNTGTSKYKKLMKSICERLVPLLVLTLKDCLLLGGSSRVVEDDQPEEIGREDGTFTACTLQFPLRIIGYIEQLWAVVRNSVFMQGDADGEEDRISRAHHRAYGPFDKHLSALKKRLLEGMGSLQEIAQRPQRILEMKERDERLRKLEDEQDLKLSEDQAKQYMDFVASTQMPLSETEDSLAYQKLGLYGPGARKRPYMGYSASNQTRMLGDTRRHESNSHIAFSQTRLLDGTGRHESSKPNHEWHASDDLKLVRLMRRFRSMCVELVAEEFPERTLADVVERMYVLKDQVRASLEKQGRRPPKWCY